MSEQTDEILERLQKHPFAGWIDDDDSLEHIAGCADLETYRAGSFVFREGDAARTFYVVVGGVIGLEVSHPSNSPRTIQTIDQDDVLGLSWLFEPHQWMFDAHVIQDVTAVSIPAQCVRDLCDANPVLGYRLMRELARVITSRLQATRIQLMDVYG